MSIDIVKHLRFRDNYNSKTINAKDAWAYGGNGLIRGGDISVAGLVITIQPFVFVQEGLVIEKLSPLVLNIPGGSDLLNRRHFIGISVGNNVESNAEVMTAVFIARPEDSNSSVVLIAEYDLTEYRKLPYISMSALAQSQKNNNLTGIRTGVSSGFSVINNPPLSTVYEVSGGELTDKTGRVINKLETDIVTVAGVDPDYPNRIDQIVFRTPNDSVVRVGTVELLTGDATKISGLDVKTAAPAVSSFSKTKTKSFTPLNISGHQFLYKDDTSTNSIVRYINFSNDFSTQNSVGSPSGPTAIGPALESFDAECDDNGLMYIFGVSALNNTQLRFNRLSSGGILTGADVVDTRVGQCKDPRILTSFTKSIVFYFWLEY